MTHLLDTNACINHLRSPDGTKITRRLAASQPGGVVLCSVVKAELIYGAERSRARQQNLAKLAKFFAGFVSLPFDDRTAEVYGRIRAQLAGRGQLIGPNDLMIAASALANELTLVTRNVAEFARVDGLRIENWE